jgi:vacuolar iron transporter family protein
MDERGELIAGLTRAWRDEMASACNYRALAQREAAAERREILERLAAAEDKHAANWAARLRELGADPGPYVETTAERGRRWLLVRSSLETAVTKLEAGEDAADALYEELARVAPSEAVRAEIVAAQIEEKAHAKILHEMTIAPPAQRKLEALLRGEKHVRGGGWIGQAIYGANDGLGAAFGVVSGVAGATGVDARFVLLSGLAAAIASALSMGSGAYLATKSEREVFEAEIERERREIEQNPAEEREELELIYQLKGFPPDEAKLLATRMAETPEHLLKTLAHEELGLSERTFPNPWRAAVAATWSTAAGAFIPVLPFFFARGTTALVASFLISTAAHFAIGAAKVVVTGRSWYKSGAEMTIVGLGEATVTYAIGLLLAPALR